MKLTCSRVRAVVALSLGLGVALAPVAAGADGAQTPQGAPTVKVGQPYYGDTSQPSGGTGVDYYRLPNLMAGDVVTVAGKSSGPNQIVCLAGDVDQFNWNQEQCNLSNYEWVTPSGERHQLVAKRATNAAYLRVVPSISRGAYQFTVERIQRTPLVSVSVPSSVSRTGTLTVVARMTNGKPVSDGYEVFVRVRVGGNTYYAIGKTKNGQAALKLNLPSSVVDRGARVSATFSGNATFVSATTPEVGTQITK